LLYQFEECAIDTDRRELRRGAELIALEPKVFDLLVYLIEHRERVVSKDDLLAALWDGRIVSESTLSTRINAARSAVGDSGEEQRLIKTLPRRGVRFVGDVRPEQAPIGSAVGDIAASPRPPFALPDRPSIAVLPFVNMSGDSEQDYFADGMAEEIITALSRCAGFFVIAQNSSFTYRGRTVDVRQVGRELGVRYVIEGSVRRSGNRLRFAGRLADATTGTHIWADRFDGELSDVFELQDRFTESVVAAIAPQLQLAEIERLKHKPAAHLDAYDLLLRAHQLEYEFTPDSLVAAVENVKRALAVDPSYAPAMALGAYCYTEHVLQGWAQNMTAERIEGARLAARAVEFGMGDGNVLWMSAYAVWNLAMDTRQAKELANRSLAINPNSAMALTTLAWIETCNANLTKGLELFRRAERLSPRDPRGWFISAGLAATHYYEGRFDEAALWAQRALNHNPRFAIALRFLAASLARQGEADKAAAVMRELLDIEPELTLTKLRARVMFLNDWCWSRYSDGLRRAGLPE
jgi:TolB-like protein/Tfp pilus assembly protein PilF